MLCESQSSWNLWDCRGALGANPHQHQNSEGLELKDAKISVRNKHVRIISHRDHGKRHLSMRHCNFKLNQQADSYMNSHSWNGIVIVCLKVFASLFRPFSSAIMIFHQVSQTGSEQEAGSLMSFLRFSLSRDLLKLCQVQAAAGLGSVRCKGFTWFHLVYHRNWCDISTQFYNILYIYKYSIYVCLWCVELLKATLIALVGFRSGIFKWVFWFARIVKAWFVEQQRPISDKCLKPIFIASISPDCKAPWTSLLLAAPYSEPKLSPDRSRQIFHSVNSTLWGRWSSWWLPGKICQVHVNASF